MLTDERGAVTCLLCIASWSSGGQRGNFRGRVSRFADSLALDLFASGVARTGGGKHCHTLPAAFWGRWGLDLDLEWELKGGSRCCQHQKAVQGKYDVGNGRQELAPHGPWSTNTLCSTSAISKT